MRAGEVDIGSHVGTEAEKKYEEEAEKKYEELTRV